MGAIRRARQGSSPHSAGYRSSACPWSCAEAHRSIPVERSRGCAARWSYNPSSLLGGLEQSDRRRTVGVHCERSQNGPLAAPFVTSVFVLHLVEARWRACSEIGNADSEVRAVDDVRRAATQCIDLLPVAVTALFVPLRWAGHVGRHGDHRRRRSFAWPSVVIGDRSQLLGSRTG